MIVSNRLRSRKSNLLPLLAEHLHRFHAGNSNAVVTQKADLIQGSIHLPSIIKGYCLFHTVKIGNSKHEALVHFVWETTITYADATPIFCKSETVSSCMKRYTQFVNNALKNGSFCVNAAGTLSFRTSVLADGILLAANEKKNFLLTKLLEKNQKIAEEALNFNLNKILYIINEQRMEDYKQNKSEKIKMRNFSEQHLRNLYSVEDKLLRKIEDPEEEKVHLKLPGNGKQNDFVVHLVQKNCVQNLNVNISLFGQGIFKKCIIQLNEKSRRRAGLLRTYRNETENRILRYIQKTQNMHYSIAKHYLIENSSNVLIELYSHGTLDQFLLEVKNASLFTKLWIFIYIADGIRELNSMGFIPTDIEPATIFIENNFFPRIGCLERCFVARTRIKEIFDDNEAKYKAYLSAFEKPTKIPYTPPELLEFDPSEHSLSEKTPVYMFGMLIINILFEMKPLPYKKESFQLLYAKIRNKAAKYTFSEREAELHGPSDVFKILRLLALRCINPEVNERPKIEDAIVVLRKIARYTEQLYAY